MKYLVAALAVCSALSAQDNDIVLRAMRDELQRAMSLSLTQLEKPYYAQYSLDDGQRWSVTASLGALVSSTQQPFRTPTVRVRVGDYKFDNTNWVGSDFPGTARSDQGRFPLDDDYGTLRRYLWLSTDSAYKGSLQAIARKRAALRSVTVSDQLPDFAPAAPARVLVDVHRSEFKSEPWVRRTRELSAILTGFRDLRSSKVELTVVDGARRFVNSEGSEVRVPETLGFVQIHASAQAKDGMILRDAQLFQTRDLERMFSQSDLQNAARNLGEHVLRLAAAPLADNYSGPVLFEGVASAQLMAELLGRNLHIARKPVTTPGTPAPSAVTELEGRRGVRILPEFFDVVDDPTQREWRSKELFGHYDVDEEGVVPKPLTLVEKGVLKDFLRTRQPVRGYNGSNGHARLNGNFGASAPTPGNLFVRARESMPVSEMKKKLTDICQQRGLPFGLIVRKFDFPSSASIAEARRMIATAVSGGSSRPFSVPIYVYRLYPDGREELVRGLRFRGLNARSLKDILAAGDDETVFDYLENGAPFALLGLELNSAEVSVIAPSVLMDDLELAKFDDEMPKLPIVPSSSLPARQTVASK